MDWVIEFLVALMLFVCGIVIFTGNISILHSYHRKNVTDVKGYGKAMGLALLIMGVAPLVSGVIHLIDINAPTYLVPVVFSVIFIVGIALVVRAQYKYNGSIF